MPLKDRVARAIYAKQAYVRYIAKPGVMEARYEYKREWQRRNKEKTAAYRKKYREANPEAAAEHSRKHRNRNPGSAYASTKAWLNRNPGRRSAFLAAYRAARLKATPIWADQEIMQLIYDEAAHRKMVVDHVIPLQGQKVCGLHIYTNTQLLSSSENARKSNKFTPGEFQ